MAHATAHAAATAGGLFALLLCAVGGCSADLERFASRPSIALDESVATGSGATGGSAGGQPLGGQAVATGGCSTGGMAGGGTAIGGGGPCAGGGVSQGASGGNGEGASGGTGGMLSGPIADVQLLDVNPTSSRFDELVSPRDYLQQVSAWYFGTAT